MKRIKVFLPKKCEKIEYGRDIFSHKKIEGEIEEIECEIIETGEKTTKTFDLNTWLGLNFDRMVKFRERVTPKNLYVLFLWHKYRYGSKKGIKKWYKWALRKDTIDNTIEKVFSEPEREKINIHQFIAERRKEGKTNKEIMEELQGYFYIGNGLWVKK